MKFTDIRLVSKVSSPIVVMLHKFVVSFLVLQMLSYTTADDEYISGKPYTYNFVVNDENKNTKFGHKEATDGKTTKGVYYVHLPDGRLQTVAYSADKTSGFRAKVEYSGKAKHPSTSTYIKGLEQSYDEDSPQLKSSQQSISPTPYTPTEQTSYTDESESEDTQGYNTGTPAFSDYQDYYSFPTEYDPYSNNGFSYSRNNDPFIFSKKFKYTLPEKKESDKSPSKEPPITVSNLLVNDPYEPPFDGFYEPLELINPYSRSGHNNQQKLHKPWRYI